MLSSIIFDPNFSLGMIAANFSARYVAELLGDKRGRRRTYVVKGIRATGRGYNARVEKVLRDALAKGKL